MALIAVSIAGKATVIGDKIVVANTFTTRFLGLMGLRSLSPGSGLLITPSSGVHTFWMRMAIDVVALDKERQVIHVRHSMRPWRVGNVNVRTKSVLELPAGRARDCGIEIGDRLEISHCQLQEVENVYVRDSETQLVQR